MFLTVISSGSEAIHRAAKDPGRGYRSIDCINLRGESPSPRPSPRKAGRGVHCASAAIGE